MRLNSVLVSLVMLGMSYSVYAGPAEEAFSSELLDCAAYYQISSEAIAAMNAPQMQAVGEKLKTSSTDAIAIAKKYRTDEQVEAGLNAARESHIKSMAGSSSLGNLMAKYKESCKAILADPQQRLDYWVMATM